MTNTPTPLKSNFQEFKGFWVPHLKIWLAVNIVLYLFIAILYSCLAWPYGAIAFALLPAFVMGALIPSLITGAIHWLISSK